MPGNSTTLITVGSWSVGGGYHNRDLYHTHSIRSILWLHISHYVVFLDTIIHEEDRHDNRDPGVWNIMETFRQTRTGSYCYIITTFHPKSLNTHRRRFTIYDRLEEYTATEVHTEPPASRSTYRTYTIHHRGRQVGRTDRVSHTHNIINTRYFIQYA